MKGTRPIQPLCGPGGEQGCSGPSTSVVTLRWGFGRWPPIPYPAVLRSETEPGPEPGPPFSPPVQHSGVHLQLVCSYVTVKGSVSRSLGRQLQCRRNPTASVSVARVVAKSLSLLQDSHLCVSVAGRDLPQAVRLGTCFPYPL